MVDITNIVDKSFPNQISWYFINVIFIKWTGLGKDEIREEIKSKYIK